MRILFLIVWLIITIVIVTVSDVSSSHSTAIPVLNEQYAKKTPARGTTSYPHRFLLRTRKKINEDAPTRIPNLLRRNHAKVALPTGTPNLGSRATEKESSSTDFPILRNVNFATESTNILRHGNIGKDSTTDFPNGKRDISKPLSTDFPIPREKELSTDFPILRGTKSATEFSTDFPILINSATESTTDGNIKGQEQLSIDLMSTITKQREQLEEPTTAYDFTRQWFNPTFPQWQFLITEFVGKPITTLEIGVFEGRSVVWTLEYILTHPNSSLIAVDSFEGSSEFSNGFQESNLDVVGMEARFRANIANTGKSSQVQIIKARSFDYLIQLHANVDSKQMFDFVYIDGSHESEAVLSDAMLIWPLLKPNGILIFDDYALERYKESYNNPGLGIEGFVNVYSFEIEVLYENFQLVIRKVCKGRNYTLSGKGF